MAPGPSPRTEGAAAASAGLCISAGGIGLWRSQKGLLLALTFHPAHFLSPRNLFF